MSEVLQQVVPARIHWHLILQVKRDIAHGRQLITNHTKSIEAANDKARRTGGRAEDDETHLYNKLREGVAYIEEALPRALNLMTETMYGFKTLEFDDAFGIQIWTELYLCSARRFLLGLSEAAKFLCVRMAVPRLHSGYTGFEVLPKGQCIALKIARSYWVAEDGLRAADGDHPLYEDSIAHRRLKTEDGYLHLILKESSDMCEELLKSCDVLFKTFELIWPGVGHSPLFPDATNPTVVTRTTR